MDLSKLFEQAAYILSPKGFKDGTVKPVGNDLLLTDTGQPDKF